MGFEIELRDSGSTVTIESGDIHSLQLPRRHSVINQWRAEVPRDLALEEWTGADAYVYYENQAQGISRQLIYRGEYERPEASDSSATMTLHGKDATRKLKRGHSVQKTYESIPYWRVVQDYTANELDWAWTVVEPTPEVIDSDKVVQDTTSGDAMADIFDPADTKPFTVQNGDLVLEQTCFVSEAENPTRQTDPIYITSNGKMSGGEARGVYSSSSNLEYDFTPNHRIPASAVGLKARVPDISDAQELEVQLDVDGVTHTLDYLTGTEGVAGPDWEEYAQEPAYNGTGYEGGDIPAGSTVTVRLTSTGSDGGDFSWDVVALYDARYSYTWDNDNGGDSGYLDGPELYPDIASVVSNPYSSTFNIQAANLTTSIDDVSFGQKLQLSNDGGDNYYPVDGSQDNTESISVDFSAQDSYGTTVRAKVSLSRYGNRDTATPKTGFKGQTLSEFTLDVTTDDLAVLDGPRDYTGNHYEILQRLHRDWGGRFVTQHRENELAAESFRPGDVEKSLDVVVKDVTRTTPDKPYANSVTVVGGEDENGNRLTATAESQSAISEDGERIPAPLVERSGLTSEGDLKSIARTELSRHLRNDDLTGMLEIWPQLVAPGYSYTVDELDGRTLSLERVDFQYGARGERGRLDFAGLSELATQLSSIRSDVQS